MSSARIRIDPSRIDVQPDMYFLVYYKSLTTGEGVSISVYIRGREYLKYDCHGVAVGHYHTYDGKRVCFREGSTRTDQVCASLLDIWRNLDSRTRGYFEPDMAAVRGILPLLLMRMLELQERHSGFGDLDEREADEEDVL